MVGLWRVPNRQSIGRIADGQPLHNDADTQLSINFAV
jgi:hypothetical protein